MKPRLVLLLTRDPAFQKMLGQCLCDGGAIVLVAHNVTDALQLVCARGFELDLAVVDFDDGCHCMTLLAAIQTCRPALAIMVVTSSDAYHATALALVNGVETCLAKPISAAELKIAIAELSETSREFVAA